MNEAFANKVALVTGAGSGMGLATAQAVETHGRTRVFRTLQKGPYTALKKLVLSLE